METSLEVYETLPIVPLRDVVVFPHMMMPFVIDALRPRGRWSMRS
jgi:ATP-dependent Lon protease